MNAPLSVQLITSLEGKPEYVLIPVAVYHALRDAIEDEIAGLEAAADTGGDYVPLKVSDYIKNPVRAARIEAGLSQGQLASRMKVSQAYVSKVEVQNKVTAKLLARVKAALATDAEHGKPREQIRGRKQAA